MRVTPTDSELTPFEILYGRPFKVPVFCSDEREHTADWMIKMLGSQEVMSINNLPDDSLPLQEECLKPGDSAHAGKVHIKRC